MKIAEVFASIQGEGKLTGVPSVFIRTSGCNLRCGWCDTPYASWRPEGTDTAVNELIDRVKQLSLRHVVLTGGEPLIQQELSQLITGLKQIGCHITIETAGTIWQDLTADLASISPKLANSSPGVSAEGNWAALHDERRINIPVLQRFAGAPRIADRQWKFVVANPSDMVEIESLMASLGNIRRDDVILMPEGIDDKTLHERAVWLADICRDKGYRFGSRLHIWLYGNRRGT